MELMVTVVVVVVAAAGFEDKLALPCWLRLFDNKVDHVALQEHLQSKVV